MTLSLCLPAASFLTGAVIPVDGGLKRFYGSGDLGSGGQDEDHDDDLDEGEAPLGRARTRRCSWSLCRSSAQRSASPRPRRAQA